MKIAESTDILWEQRPNVIRAFIEMRPRFEKLGEEVAYILERLVRSSQIEYSTIVHRVKSLDSFCDKVIRKIYKYPLKEVTDIAGVRIVFLYLIDRPKIEKLIEKEFNVIEKLDKVIKREDDRFGYGALHYLVHLGKKASGARYDDLKDLVCEVQIRTVLQDSWAIVAHHLSYKQESDVPKELRRKLNALSGLFETADDQFDQLRQRRQDYKDVVRQQISQQTKGFLQSAINTDNLAEFLNWRLSDREAPDNEMLTGVLSELAECGYTKLADLDDAITRTYNAVQKYEQKYPPRDLKTGEHSIYTQVGIIRVALNFLHESYRKGKWSHEWEARYLEFQDLVQ